MEKQNAVDLILLWDAGHRTFYFRKEPNVTYREFEDSQFSRFLEKVLDQGYSSGSVASSVPEKPKEIAKGTRSWDRYDAIEYAHSLYRIKPKNNDSTPNLYTIGVIAKDGVELCGFGFRTYAQLAEDWQYAVWKVSSGGYVWQPCRK